MERLPRAIPRTKDTVLGWEREERWKHPQEGGNGPTSTASLPTSISGDSVRTRAAEKPCLEEKRGSNPEASVRRLGPGLGTLTCVTLGIIHALSSTLRTVTSALPTFWDYSEYLTQQWQWNCFQDFRTLNKSKTSSWLFQMLCKLWLQSFLCLSACPALWQDW